MAQDQKAKQEAQEFDTAVLALENEFSAFGSRAINDANVRERYRKMVQKMAEEMRAMAVRTGNYAEAAKLATQLRNELMDSVRSMSSDVGRELAFKMKQSGKTLDFLLDRAAIKKFGRGFSKVLDNPSRQKVFLEVIESAGRANAGVSRSVRILGKAGRGFIVVTMGIAIYEVATAEDKKRAAARQVASLSMGSMGSIAGGWVGLACGPGAVVCVPLGVFVGGALGAVAADFLF